MKSCNSFLLEQFSGPFMFFFDHCFCTGDVSRVISLQPALNFNGGGHLNHTIFWDILSPNGGGTPKGDLLEVINRDFGSFDKLKNELTARAVGVQGSGWGWVGYNKGTGRLRMAQTSNQDPLEATTGEPSLT